MLATEPFLIDLNLTPDHDDNDIEREIRDKFSAQTLLPQFLRGEISVEHYEDTLADCGVDPYLYWEVVDANIDHVIEQETVLEESEFLLVDQFGFPLYATA